MTLLQVAMRNLQRRRGRTLFLLLIFTIISGIIFTLVELTDFLKKDLQQSLNQYGANVIITPRSEHLNLSYGGLAVPGATYDIKTLDDKTLSKITESAPEIISIAPKVIGVSHDQTNRILIIGVDFSSELKMKPWWKIQGQIPRNEEIVVGAALSAKKQLAIGSKLELNGEIYRVAGILSETGGSEDRSIIADIPTARKITEQRTSWSLIELNAANPEATSQRLASILPEAKVVSISELVQGSKENVERFANFSRSMAGVFITLGTLMLFLILSANLNDRLPEFGILRAIGFRRKHIYTVILQEMALLALAGGTFGYLSGLFLPKLLGPLVFQKVIPSENRPLALIIIISSSLLIGVFSSVYPVWKILRRNPLESLHGM